MTKLLGWAALVGGGLSGAVAGLLFLGPMLGFYEFGAHPPGPRTTGAVELPAPLVQRTPDTGSRPARALTSPLGTFGVVAPATATAGGTVAAPLTPAVRGPRQALGDSVDPVTTGSSQAPAPAPATQPVAPAPATIAPVAPVTAAPVAPAAPATTTSPTPSAAQPTTGKRPTTAAAVAQDEDDGSAQDAPVRGSETRDEDRAAREAAREQRRTEHAAIKAARQHAPPVAAPEPAPAPVTAAEAGDEDGHEQDAGAGWEHGRSDDEADHDHEGRGNGHAKHDEKDFRH